ncbi:MAG: T9SS type A sorting domain-containing protein [Bacteroidota bacterium]
MKYFFLTSFFCCLSYFALHSQNLVQNPGFENFESCPDNGGQISRATHWDRPELTTGTPDYYNRCFEPSPPAASLDIPFNWTGYQEAHNGDGYAGVYNFGYGDLREYIQSRLIAPLETGWAYQVGFYVNTSNLSGIAIDALGAYFSADPLVGEGDFQPFLGVTPQINNPTGNILTDTAAWTYIEGHFVATGGEEFITIGNFLTDSMTQHIIYDEGYAYGQGYTFIDDVSVVLADSVTNVNNIADKDTRVQIFPNPTPNNFTVSFLEGPFVDCCLYLYNFNGKLVKTQNIYSVETEIVGDDLTHGIYFYKIIGTNNKVFSGKLIVGKG